MAEHMRIGIDVSLLLYPEVVGMRIYFERLLDFSAPNKPVVLNNADWLTTMSAMA